MIKNWGKRIKKALPPTIVITLIFFLNYFYFSMENTVIALFMTPTFIRLSKKEAIFNCYLKTIIIYVLLCILSYIALFDDALNIIVNVCALFWITYLIIDEYNPNNYFSFGMALILFQMSPVDAAGLIIRLFSLTASSLIVLVAVMMFHPKRENGNLNKLCSDGLLLTGKILKGLSETPHAEVGHYKKELRTVNEAISYILYRGDESRFFKREDVSHYFTFINVFQNILEISDENDLHGFSRKNIKIYLRQFSMQLLKIHDLWKVKDYDLCIKQLEGFEYSCCSESGYLAEKFTYVSRLLISAFVQSRKQGYTYIRWDSRHYRWYAGRIITKISFNSSKLKFALRMTVVMTPCLFFAYKFHFIRAYWLPISVLFMLLPDYKQVGRRVLERIGGTMLGIGICFVLYTTFSSSQALIVIMCISNFCTYMSESYLATVAYVTCSVLSLNVISQVPDVLDRMSLVLGQRLVYTMAGAVIVLVSIRFVFPEKPGQDIRFYTKQLIYLNGKFEDILSCALNGKLDKGLIDEMTVEFYLMISKLNEYCTKIQTDGKRSPIKQFIELQIYWLADISYIIYSIIEAPKDRIPESHVVDRIRKYRSRKENLKKLQILLFS